MINHRLNRGCPLQREGRFDIRNLFSTIIPCHMSRTILQALIFLSARADNGNNGNAFGPIIMERFAIRPLHSLNVKLNVRLAFILDILVYKIVDGFEIVNKLDSKFILEGKFFYIFKKELQTDGIFLIYISFYYIR